MCERGHGSIVQVEVRHIHGCSIQGFSSQSKSVILAGDFHLTSGPAWMVEPAMAIGKLERAAPEGQPQDLMPEADSEQRHFGLLQQRTGQGNPITHR